MATPTDIQIITDVAAIVGARVRRHYTGRGILGRQCIGIVGPNAAEIVEEAAANGLRGAEQDAMGRDYIVYWPGIEDPEILVIDNVRPASAMVVENVQKAADAIDVISDQPNQ